MKKSYEYLIEALDLLPERTDGEKAKSLKIAANTLSQYKKGERVMDDFACIMVARVLGIDPMRIIAACQEEREKSEERREFWRDFRNTLGSWIAVSLVCLTLLMAPATPAQASALHAVNAYDIVFIMSNNASEFGATTPLFATFSTLLFNYFVCVIYNTNGMDRIRMIRLFHFGKSEDALAAELGVTVSTVQAWKAGKASVPVVCVKYLELLDSNELRCASVWNGGSRLIVPAGYQVGIEYAEIERLADYRQRFHLRTMQTDLIERLMIERNFYYHDNCHRQARFGLMVDSLFG